MNRHVHILRETNTSNAHMQVAMVTGLDEAAKEDLAKGPTHGGHHIAKLLKFLTVRTERGRDKLGLGLVGGRWNSKLDGGNPRSA